MQEEREFRSQTEYDAWLRACAGKDKFPSEEAAEAYKKEMSHGNLIDKITRPKGFWKALVVYPCKFCDGFHLGNDRKPV